MRDYLWFLRSSTEPPVSPETPKTNRGPQRHLSYLIQSYLSALENGGESLCPDRMTTRRHKSAKVSWLWNMSLGIPFNFSGQGLCESIRDWLGIWSLVLLAVDPGDFCDQL